jgi:hypothetical protein
MTLHTKRILAEDAYSLFAYGQAEMARGRGHYRRAFEAYKNAWRRPDQTKLFLKTFAHRLPDILRLMVLSAVKTRQAQGMLWILRGIKMLSAPDQKGLAANAAKGFLFIQAGVLYWHNNRPLQSLQALNRGLQLLRDAGQDVAPIVEDYLVYGRNATNYFYANPNANVQILEEVYLYKQNRDYLTGLIKPLTRILIQVSRGNVSIKIK